MRLRPGLARGVGAVVAIAAVTGIGAALWWHDALTYDVGVYRRYGEAMASGQMPYRDFRLEYPPGALPVLVAPALVTDSEDAYRAVFAVEAACIEIAALLVGLGLLGRLGASRRHRRAYVACGAVVAAFPLGSVALTRFDFWPVLLLLAALACLLAGRTRLAGAVLGIAIAAKIFPIVVAPVLLAYVWRRGSVREARATLLAIVASTTAVFLPFAVVAPRGVASSLWEQFGRPLQIESLGSAVVIALHKLFGVAAGSGYGHGSYNLTGSAASITASVTTIVLVLALCVVWFEYATGPAEAQWLVAYSVASVAAFATFSKVLSPQFLLWLVPLIPLVGGRRGVLATSLLAAAAGLTTIWIPFRQTVLVNQFAPLPSWSLLLRDLVLVAVVVTVVPWTKSMATASRIARRADAPL